MAYICTVFSEAYQESTQFEWKLTSNPPTEKKQDIGEGAAFENSISGFRALPLSSFPFLQ